MAAAPTVWVVVLGDFGRSPRMQYHAWSLAEAGYDVRVLASPGSPPIRPLLDARNVRLHYLAPPPPWVGRLPALAALLAKALLQAGLMLWAVLAALPRPAAILMQNPPAIPVMAVLWLAALRHRAALIIDWHNLAYSILALKHGRRRWLIRLARAYERFFGRRAAAHFTVTRAMAAFLRAEFGITAAVLYDRPPEMFRPLASDARAAALGRLGPQLTAAAIGAPLALGALGGGTAAGGGGGGGRPAVVVSSTSWTPDEDFGILLDAALRYDAAAATAAGQIAPDRAPDRGGLPDVLFVITGRGPQRDEYLGRIRRLALRRCAFASVWLEPEDYPLLLGAADLGVCLHTSSSGLDLPMKARAPRERGRRCVVDMFGAGLPVCAVRFDCIGELITDGETGLLFDGPEALAAQLQELLWGFGGGGGGGGGRLGGMRAAVERTQCGRRWRENWREVAAPVVAAACGGPPGGGAGAGAGAGGRKRGVRAS
ncbi:MAG: hypothetical protein J3K34DRAFT_377533 [Monoraphidium minutum]|nr:MAG: hypothetical protein J3K34DRAFT_377533 [Monoraphidium minutum]